MRYFLSFLCFFAFSADARGINQELYTDYAPTINIICANRSGLARDRTILQEALKNLGCIVHWFDGDHDFDATPADVNIFCEKLHAKCLGKARWNWFIPNPEWLWHDPVLLNYVDLVLCRTHEVQRIFSNLNKRTYFLGFSSPNHHDQLVTKDYTTVLHLAGASWQKGTLPLLKAWSHHPEFPHLTAIRFADPTVPIPQNVTWISSWLEEKELRRLQNSCGIHICLSETEGFGHALMESMGVGAVVVTTDAPPMNEFIRDKRCLVPWKSKGSQKLATNYYVASKNIEKKVLALLRLPQSELEKIGQENRARYRQMRKNFHRNLANLIDTLR